VQTELIALPVWQEGWSSQVNLQEDSSTQPDPASTVMQRRSMAHLV